MATAVSAIATCRASLSASEKTATVSIPILRAVLMIRQAISPRLATRIRLNIPCTAPDAGPLACGVMTKKSIAFLRWHKGKRDPKRDTGGHKADQNKTRQAQRKTTAPDEHADNKFADRIGGHGCQDREGSALRRYARELCNRNGNGVDVSKTRNGSTQDHAQRTDALTDNARSNNDEPKKYREGNH